MLMPSCLPPFQSNVSFFRSVVVVFSCLQYFLCCCCCRFDSLSPTELKLPVSRLLQSLQTLAKSCEGSSSSSEAEERKAAQKKETLLQRLHW